MKKTKVVPMYLPQFHRIPENDVWWGEGFTEWTNVKKTKPLFDGHIQPRAPINFDYYDLSNPEILLKQMRLAKDYGIDGFCFYHYWFKDGKKLLEKPIELMLKNDSLPIDFCLCWANEPWTRNWDGDLGSKVTLMQQEYGTEKDWDKHFDYLLQFFIRDEYIKKDGRPVLLIYRPEDIPCFSLMKKRWNERAEVAGIGKLFIITVHRLNICDELPLLGDAIVDFEPFATLYNMTNEELEQCSIMRKGYDGEIYNLYDYKKVTEIGTSKYRMAGINHYYGCFPGWDNTPRVGKKKDVVKFVDNTVGSFHDYFKKQYNKSIKNNNEFLFINAWNEWGEGAFIEPDQVYKYGYLEAIKAVVNDEDYKWEQR